MKRPTYTNDKNAPRMRKGAFSQHILTKELYETFIEKMPEYKDVTWHEFRKIWDDISQTIREEVITNPLGVKLPKYTGELKLQYLPYKYKALDHNTSQKIGEKVNHLNIDEKGKVGKIKWERRWAVKFNKMLQFFAFEPVRELNIMAKSHIDESPESLRMSRGVLGGYHVWRLIKDRQ